MQVKRNYIIDSNKKLIILLTSDVQIKLKNMLGYRKVLMIKMIFLKSKNNF